MNRGSKLIFITFQIFILSLGVCFGIYLMSQEQEEIKNELIRFNQTLALSISPEDIGALGGNVNDLEKPEYIKLKILMQKAKAIQPDARFAYLFGQKEDKSIFFYVDNEPSTSPDYSPPGQVYTQAAQEDLNIFEDGKPVVVSREDIWGKWISIEIPIFNPMGKVIATLNTDMPQSIYFRRVYGAGLLPLLISIMLMLVFFVIRKVSENREKMLLQRSEYFSVAAHDLKAPLVGMKWLLENLIKIIPPESAALKNNLEKIHSSSREMLASIEDLLNASKSQFGSIVPKKRERINLLGITRKIVLNLNLLAQQNKLTINIKLPANLQILGDSESVRRAIGNLISNAIKYSHKGGVIDISGKIDEETVIWKISDKGIGIPKSEIDKVVMGYYRATNAKNKGIPGTGLGLYYTKKVIEYHKGVLNLESEEDKGLTVTVKLPALVR